LKKKEKKREECPVCFDVAGGVRQTTLAKAISSDVAILLCTQGNHNLHVSKLQPSEILFLTTLSTYYARNSHMQDFSHRRLASLALISCPFLSERQVL
jgi:hypothetical protein